MRKYVICFGVLLLLTGCATPFQKMAFMGGYDDNRLDENVFQVYVRGNGYTTAERVQEIAFLRASQLCQQYGFQYFVIAKSDGYVSTSYVSTPTQTQTTGNIQFYGNSAYGSSTSTTYGGQTYAVNRAHLAIIIVCFKDKPDTDATTFNAQYTYDSLAPKLLPQQ
jgi:hypothetical protein